MFRIVAAAHVVAPSVLFRIRLPCLRFLELPVVGYTCDSRCVKRLHGPCIRGQSVGHERAPRGHERRQHGYLRAIRLSRVVSSGREEGVGGGGRVAGGSSVPYGGSAGARAWIRCAVGGAHREVGRWVVVRDRWCSGGQAALVRAVGQQTTGTPCSSQVWAIRWRRSVVRSWVRPGRHGRDPGRWGR